MMIQVPTGPPTITTHPASQLINFSMSATLNCEGTGRELVTYKWQTRNINGGQWSDISNRDDGRLVVRNLRESQQYRCVVSNKAGATISNNATVTVLSELFLCHVCISTGMLQQLLISLIILQSWH